MKKSLHSLLTAAMFAAAVTTSAGGISNTQNASAAPAENDLITETTEPIPQPDYGPPHWFTDTETEATLTTTTDVTAEIQQPVYGPPYVLFEKGDLNGDRVLNAKDLTLLKRAVLYDNLDSFWRPLGDLNDDGAVDKKDVKELIRRLTGAPEEDPEETDVTTTGTDATVPPRLETTTDPYWDYPMPLYGPPTAY